MFALVGDILQVFELFADATFRAKSQDRDISHLEYEETRNQAGYHNQNYIKVVQFLQ